MEDVSLEELILQNLLNNAEFVGKTISYINDDYFEDRVNKAIFNVVKTYYTKTNNIPEQNILRIELLEQNLNESEQDDAKGILKSFCTGEVVNDLDWLLSQAEQWCRERSMYLAIMKAISIYDGTDKTLSPHVIPDLMENALSVSFETRIGSDWQEDAEVRFDQYTLEENKIPFDLEILNDITFNGVTRKTLNLILAGVHVGKTMALVHLAAGYARHGYNVLYISMEMGENEILQRIDANMLKTPMHAIKTLGKDKFVKRIHKLKEKSYGQIKVLQYPTSLGHVGHFKNAIAELKAKMHWEPDIVMVDYIGIVASSRIKVGMTNSHFYLKSVAEELRAFAIENNLVLWSAMQLTRTGMGSNDVEMTDIAESIGIPGVCDFMIAVHRNAEMDSLGQVSCKQLKNRYRNMGYRSKFIIGAEFEQQLLYDVSQREQDDFDSEDVQININAIQSKYTKKKAPKYENIDVGDDEQIPALFMGDI